MNQDQKKYAIKRINEIANVKIEEAKKKFTTPEVKLGATERYDLIVKHKVPLIPFNKQNEWEICRGEVKYDFSKYTKEESFDVVEFRKVKGKIDALVTEIEDKLMLGTDAKEALDMFKLIEGFKI